MPTKSDVINLQGKFASFSDHWSPRIVAQLNDYHVKLAKVEGRFPWHKHDETDELFLVISGQLSIDLRQEGEGEGEGEGEEETVEIAEGELFVVPRGMLHAPHARTETQILLLEPAGTVNTGDREEEGTEGVWI